MASFRWGAEIGSGTFGRVQEAFFADPDDSRDSGVRLAVKFLKDEFVDDEDALRRFTGEVRILQTLDHPNVINIVARNLSKTPPWFVMPRADSNLEVEQRGRTGDVGWIVPVFNAVLSGMAYAHAQDVIHRDLKPENVLFIGDRAVVTDFGLGRRLDSESTRLTMSAQAMGTFAYMAPEQYGNVKYAGAPADVYALGKVLWEMLSGDRPQPFRPPDLDAIAGEFRHFVSRCCADQPDDRYPNAGEALAAFDVLTATTPHAATDPPVQVAERLVQQWAQTPEGADVEVLRQLDEHLMRYSDEEELYFDLVPRLPRNLVEQYIVSFPDGFAQMLAHYDSHISGGLPFDYCDTVANFYEFVFERVTNARVRRMIVARLLIIGPAHNRWHVGRVLGRMLGAIDDTATDQMAAEAIRENPYNARWFLPYIEIQQLPRLVAAAFQQADDGETEESSGFTGF